MPPISAYGAAMHERGADNAYASRFPLAVSGETNKVEPVNKKLVFYKEAEVPNSRFVCLFLKDMYTSLKSISKVLKFSKKVSNSSRQVLYCHNRQVCHLKDKVTWIKRRVYTKQKLGYEWKGIDLS